jgi:hypothetical protein
MSSDGPRPSREALDTVFSDFRFQTDEGDDRGRGDCTEDALVTGSSFAAAVGYSRDFHRITAEHVRVVTERIALANHGAAPLTLIRQALLLCILTKAPGPIVGGLTVISDADLIKGAVSADALISAKSAEDLIGIPIPEFDADRLVKSAEMCLSAIMCAFAQGKERQTIRLGPRRLLTRKQYRKIFKSRFRLIFARQALTDAEVQADADDLMVLIRGVFFNGAAGLHALVGPPSPGREAHNRPLTEQQMVFADHVMCNLLLCDDMVDVLQGIMTAKRCFASCHLRHHGSSNIE